MSIFVPFVILYVLIVLYSVGFFAVIALYFSFLRCLTCTILYFKWINNY